MKDTEAFDVAKRRLYEVSGCKNYYERAEFLETKAAQISVARRRLRIPVEWLRTTFFENVCQPGMDSHRRQRPYVIAPCPAYRSGGARVAALAVCLLAGQQRVSASSTRVASSRTQRSSASSVRLRLFARLAGCGLRS